MPDVASQFEAERLSVVLEEKSHALKQSQTEAEVATKKLRLVSDQFYHLEATTARKLADLDGVVAQQVSTRLASTVASPLLPSSVP
jgi:hypothetical protein